jgi:hypothetical protein
MAVLSAPGHPSIPGRSAKPVARPLSTGLLAYIFARIFAEPVINQAISYEPGRDAELREAAGPVGL